MKKYNRRSKSERNLCSILRKEKFRVIANDRSLCNGFEIDVLLPDYKVAIEWNGIYHRSPIYGFKKLSIIKQNDKIKHKMITDQGYTLVIINDLDSKKPLQYANQACDLIKKMIEKGKNIPSQIYTLEFGEN
jgi:very-short-patch-repair endonuclease